jgi:hypothetical protein
LFTRDRGPLWCVGELVDKQQKALEFPGDVEGELARVSARLYALNRYDTSLKSWYRTASPLPMAM